MEVLILSKTHMANSTCCVGAMTMAGQYLRLLTADGKNQPETTEFSPRQIWEMDFNEKRSLKAPHVEDVLIQTKSRKGDLSKKIKVIDFIKDKKTPIWRGHPDSLFDEKIKWTDRGI